MVAINMDSRTDGVKEPGGAMLPVKPLCAHVHHLEALACKRLRLCDERANDKEAEFSKRSFGPTIALKEGAIINFWPVWPAS